MKKDGIIGIAALVCLTGCASVGHKIDRAGAESIKIGDTREGVRAAIGKPDGIGKDAASGQETWTYIYTFSSAKPEMFIPIAGAFLGGANTSTDSVTVSFGPDGRVTNVNTSFAKSEASTNLSTANNGDERKTDGTKPEPRPAKPSRGQ